MKFIIIESLVFVRVSTVMTELVLVSVSGCIHYPSVHVVSEVLSQRSCC